MSQVICMFANCYATFANIVHLHMSGNNDEDDGDNEDDDQSFHSSVFVEPKKKAAGNKFTELAYSTRSRTALRRSKRV